MGNTTVLAVHSLVIGEKHDCCVDVTGTGHGCDDRGEGRVGRPLRLMIAGELAARSLSGRFIPSSEGYVLLRCKGDMNIRCKPCMNRSPTIIDGCGAPCCTHSIPAFDSTAADLRSRATLSHSLDAGRLQPHSRGRATRQQLRSRCSEEASPTSARTGGNPPPPRALSAVFDYVLTSMLCCWWWRRRG